MPQKTILARSVKPTRPSSELEELFALHLRASGITGYVRELKFGPNRQFRFDFAWENEGLAVEVEGGTWSGGRHVTGKGFESDCEKYNLACLLGWRVLRFTGKQVKSGIAIDFVQNILSVNNGMIVRSVDDLEALLGDANA